MAPLPAPLPHPFKEAVTKHCRCWGHTRASAQAGSGHHATPALTLRPTASGLRLFCKVLDPQVLRLFEDISSQFQELAPTGYLADPRG